MARLDVAVRTNGASLLEGLEDQLANALKGLMRRARGIRGVVVVDGQGLPIASEIDRGLDLNVIAAMSTLITESAGSVLANLGIKGPKLIMIEGEEANVAAIPVAAGQASVLAVLQKDANLGLVRLELQKAATQVGQALGVETASSSTISELFVLHGGGTLIRHYSDSLRTDLDRDILGGMLTAVQSFVKQTLATMGGQLDEMRYGEHTIAFVRGKHTIVAAVVHGRDLESVRYRISDALQEFEERYRDAIVDWNGSGGAFPGIDDCFSKVLHDPVPSHLPDVPRGPA
jgi:predicted regulator of Ras-like GTPase activity (Roadblock/LC7/MglB family)